MKEKIYLLPGIMTNENLWIDLCPYLEQEYELIHVSIPLKDSLDEIIEELSKKFKNSKINLIGFSLGGYIGTYFSLKYPHLINKLFIVASSPCMFLEEEIQKRKNAISFVKQNGLKELSSKKVLSLLGKDNVNNKSLIKHIQRMYKDMGKDVFISQFTSTLIRKNLLKDLLAFDNVITFFYSCEDRLVNQEFLNNLKLKRKDFIFIKMQGNSHMIPLENPKELSSAIRIWLKDV